jgi:hypothetical protein
VVGLVVTADSSPSAARRFFGLWRTRALGVAFALFVLAAAMVAEAFSRRMLLGLLAICLSASTTLLVLEAAGAIGLVSWAKLFARRSSNLGVERIPHLRVSGTTWQDTASLWGLPSEPVAYSYKTDRRGFRNDSDRDIADIYLLGDSVVLGALVPFRASVTAALERLSGKRVMQIALSGIGPQEAQQLFRDANVDIRNGLLVQFVFEGNDYGDSRRYRKTAYEVRHESIWERSLSNQIILSLQRLTDPVAGVAATRTCSIGGSLYTFFWVRESFAGLEDEANAIGVALRDFAAEVRREGGRFGVVFVPSKLRVLGPFCRFPVGSELSNYASHVSPLRRYLHDWSASNKIDLLDLTDPLQEAARAGRIPWFWGDTHWNAEGHAVAARALSEWHALRLTGGN